jgi:XTP/dITP diphosphohydrolase
VRSLIDYPDAPGIKEDGKSFSENALKKARFYSALFKTLTIADDSGLEVDALRGRPGIYSARYAGEGATDRKNKQRLLAQMKRVSASKRGAQFVCSLAVVSAEGKEAVVEGMCRGWIGFKEVGKKGFGYDALFVLPRSGKAMAQLALAEKDRISHRGKALRRLRKVIKDFMS